MPETMLMYIIQPISMTLAATVDEYLSFPVDASLNAAKTLAPVSPAEPIEQLRHGCIGTCSRDQDIQYEWYDYLFHV